MPDIQITQEHVTLPESFRYFVAMLANSLIEFERHPHHERDVSLLFELLREQLPPVKPSSIPAQFVPLLCHAIDILESDMAA